MRSRSISNQLLIEGEKAFDKGNGFPKLLHQPPPARNVQINGFWDSGWKLVFIYSKNAKQHLESCFLKKRRPVAYRKKMMTCEA